MFYVTCIDTVFQMFHLELLMLPLCTRCTTAPTQSSPVNTMLVIRSVPISTSVPATAEVVPTTAGLATTNDTVPVPTITEDAVPGSAALVSTSVPATAGVVSTTAAPATTDDAVPVPTITEDAVPGSAAPDAAATAGSFFDSCLRKVFIFVCIVLVLSQHTRIPSLYDVYHYFSPHPTGGYASVFCKKKGPELDCVVDMMYIETPKNCTGVYGSSEYGFCGTLCYF